MSPYPVPLPFASSVRPARNRRLSGAHIALKWKAGIRRKSNIDLATHICSVHRRTDDRLPGVFWNLQCNLAISDEEGQVKQVFYTLTKTTGVHYKAEEIYGALLFGEEVFNLHATARQRVTDS
jgi:hypothetical protein